jgi:16S rRNA (uracil1498-N3)-methyltransferase
VSKPLRVPLDGLVPGRRRLEGALLRYVTRVHRLGPGDALSCFDPASAMEADGTLAAAPGDGVVCDVGELRPSAYRALPITLMQGLAKGMKPDLTLRDATALGVERVLFVATEHAVVQLIAERAAIRQERWRRIAAEAARQSGRGNLPSIEGPLSFEAGLSRARESRRITLVPGAPPLFEQLAGLSGEGSIALLVGPEGGLSEREIEQSRQAGFVPASLGALVLRTELAASVALGALVAWSARPPVR